MRPDWNVEQNMPDNMQWAPKAGIDSPALRDFEKIWRGWSQDGALPLRTSFDPLDFATLLPWMLLAEIVPPGPAVTAIPYDLLIRYVGREFAYYFSSRQERRLLSELASPYLERWFAVYDAARQAKAPCYFEGSPIGTGHEYLTLEILVLPFDRIPGDVGFVLCTFARKE